MEEFHVDFLKCACNSQELFSYRSARQHGFEMVGLSCDGAGEVSHIPKLFLYERSSPCSCGVFYLPTGGVEVEMFGI